MKKIVIVFLLPLFSVLLLSSQSLVELSKKEKERRAKLKEKTSHIVTNNDLTVLRKKPAVTVSLPESEEAGAAEALENVPSEEVSSQPSEEAVPNAGEDTAEVEKKLKEAQDLVELLTLKINSLWVRFYSFEDWTLRDEIQRDMNDTNAQLEQVKQDVENLKLELSRLKSKKQ